MIKWAAPTKTTNLGGWFQIVMTKVGQQPVDVTFFRGVPTQLSNYTNADPFGDSTAVMTFPGITGFDDPQGADLNTWLDIFTNVDIWWVPGIDPTTLTEVVDSPVYYVDPRTNQADIIAPPILSTHPSGSPTTHHTTDNRIKVWEGFITSIDINSDETSNSVQIQCQGALFQLDRYLQKPFYPPQPIPLELLIQQAFDKTRKPHLRTQPLQIQWPTGWHLVVPAHGTVNAYTLDAPVGSNWTGYASRSTGAWDRTLTGFIQDQLTVMITQQGSGVYIGNQWTLQQQREVIAPATMGRTPVLMVRDKNRTPDFTIWVGTPGVTLSVTRDGTQMANIIYGDGTSLDGTTWRNTVISNDGTRTDYKPLAAAPNVWPYVNNKSFSTAPFVAEAYLQFGTGFDQTQAATSAATTLARDLDPGFTGSMTLKVDPSNTLSRFLIRSGMTVLVKGLYGTAADGLRFHISEVDVDVTSGTATLKLDTRYRDLLTVQESYARTRDPLTPTKMLQAGRTSIMIEDVQAPWDYNAGSGFIPKASTAFFKTKPTTSAFPYTDWTVKYPPIKYPQYYVKVNANATTRTGRWTLVPILTSEKGTIRRTEVVCLDKYGNVLKNPFHLSIYYINVTPSAMPRDANGPSPYINNAFTTINPLTGAPWPPVSSLTPQPSMIVEWGSQINGVMQRAGFSPGAEASGDLPTGLLVDENTWQFDNTSGDNSHGWDPYLAFGKTQTAASITLYAMFYAEYTQPVYFLGRLYRQEPGT